MTVGVVESGIQKPLAGSIRWPLEVAVMLYPLAALVVTVRRWAEILIAALLIIPKLIVLAVAAMPVFVLSVFVQPVVLLVLIAVASPIPAIVKVRLGSTVACTWTDSI